MTLSCIYIISSYDVIVNSFYEKNLPASERLSLPPTRAFILLSFSDVSVRQYHDRLHIERIIRENGLVDRTAHVPNGKAFPASDAGAYFYLPPILPSGSTTTACILSELYARTDSSIE